MSLPLGYNLPWYGGKGEARERQYKSELWSQIKCSGGGKRKRIEQLLPCVSASRTSYHPLYSLLCKHKRAGTLLILLTKTEPHCLVSLGIVFISQTYYTSATYRFPHLLFLTVILALNASAISPTCFCLSLECHRFDIVHRSLFTQLIPGQGHLNHFWCCAFELWDSNHNINTSLCSWQAYLWNKTLETGL